MKRIGIKQGLALCLLAGIGIAVGQEAGAATEETVVPAVDGATTVWMLVSTALVLLMLPGLAMFYGGLARTKNVIGTMMHTFVAMAIIGVLWVICGYGLCFGDSIGGIIGWDSKYLFLQGIDNSVIGAPGSEIPEYAMVMFQCMFAIITPALISGALAERVTFRGYCVFITLWCLLVYCPLCHMVWGGGILSDATDLAGGLVIHVSAGISALVIALLLGTRIGHPKNTLAPNNLVMTLIGAGLLWMGWFGFNAGSTAAADMSTARVLANTQISASAGALAWLIIEAILFKKATGLGFASGVLAGLVVITPAAATVGPGGALCLGALSSIACFLALKAKDKFGYDDSLDCFGIHGVGSGLGVILLVLFARAGESPSMIAQLKGMGVTIVLGAVMTVIIYFLIEKTIGFRLPPAQEKAGMDSSLHGEQGYGMLNLN